MCVYSQRRTVLAQAGGALDDWDEQTEGRCGVAMEVCGAETLATIGGTLEGATGRMTATLQLAFVDREKFDTASGWKLGMFSFEQVSGERISSIRINNRESSLAIKRPSREDRRATIFCRLLE